MSKIEIGRFSEQLRRMLGQKGQEQVAGELSAEVSPTIELEGPTPEWDFLKGVRRCGNGTRITAGVGFNPRFRLRNPLASGVLASVDLVSATGDVTNLFFTMGLLEVNVDLPLPSVSTVMDGRWEAQGANQTALVMSADNTTAVFPGGQIFMRERTLANVANQYDQGVVLPPGFAIEWGLTSTNRPMSTFSAWRERGIPRLEL